MAEELTVALWPLVDMINGAGVAGGGGSTDGAMGGGRESVGCGDVAGGGGLEEDSGEALKLLGYLILRNSQSEIKCGLRRQSMMNLDRPLCTGNADRPLCTGNASNSSG
ncbi:actin 4 [Actinidia rufa]|uniref:Actin 4 n=1 Tax=Actinidia rufa TaxID=165716 RepID=A0A7J0G369_9ERIC|nr:actin 4 [Actinidia rufa]